MYDPNRVEVMILEMKQRSFPLDLNKTNTQALTNSIDETMLWHKRLGHYHNARLSHLHKRDNDA